MPVFIEVKFATANWHSVRKRK